MAARDLACDNGRPAPNSAIPNPGPAAVATIVREIALARLLIAYIVSGVVFMLLPGTFLGVWNLISISSHEAVRSISPAWIQAHGQAQVFGWVGSFILGIGFHSIPRLRNIRFALWKPWVTLGLWTSAVALRWFAGVYQWHWRLLLPLTAAAQIAAFAIFFSVIAGHRSASGKGLDAWIKVVIAGTLGFFAALVLNFAFSWNAALHAATPAFPAALDQRFLPILGWGFLVPFVWGFSARWLPVFLGLPESNAKLLAAAVALNTAGVVLAAGFCGALAASVLLLFGSLFAIAALHVFQSAARPAKSKGVHRSFPAFVRSAYAWLLISAALGIWAAVSDTSGGIGGASRHALTVGFVAMMVFNIGQRVLPAFGGMRLLFSTRLMFAASALLTIGCALRVTSEVLAYQQYAAWAWHVLPVSAVIELSAVTAFALNLAVTFLKPPPVAFVDVKQFGDRRSIFSTGLISFIFS